MIKRSDSRGLSTIVATLLIILLTLVAVGVIWVVVRNVIQQGAEQVSLGKFTLNLEIKNVGIDPASPSNVNVRIRRNPGEGEISGLNFIIDDGDTTEVVKMVNFSLNELEERTINLSLQKITNSSKILKVSVAPIFRLESGKDVTGDVKDEYEMPKTVSNGGTVCTPICSGKNCGSNGCGGTCGSCSGSQTCNANGQCVVVSICGNNTREGSEGCDDGDTSSGDGCSSNCVVESGYTCNTATPNVCTLGCTPESNSTFCTRLGKNCGSVTALDNCGTSRTVTSCGTCTSPQTCAGGGTANVCGSAGCTPESNSTFCTRLGKNCGSVTALDNCGTSRTVTSCGTCTGGQTCNGTNQCSNSAPAWQTGMVSWWRLNGNANDSIGPNDGTVNGATLTSTGCKSGQCYSFDGIDNRLDINTGSLTITSSFTTSAWVKSTADNNGRIITKHGPGVGNYGWLVSRNSGYDSVEFHISTDGSNWFGGITSTNSWLINTWYNIVTTYNGTFMRVYINGVENTGGDFPASVSGNVHFAPGLLLIGDDENGGGNKFNGLIDEVMLFNRSLSSAEIQQIYVYSYP